MNNQFLAFPTEIILEIAKCLPLRDIVSLRKTCHTLHYPLHAFLMSKYKDDILIFAAIKDDLPLLTSALSAGADPAYSNDDRGVRWTALHHAASNGHTQIIREILLYNPPLDQRDSDNNTALLIAALDGHQVAVDLLIAAGADTCATNCQSHQTLLRAAIQSNLEATAIAYIDQTDEDALHEAMDNDRLAIARLMFTRGITTSVPHPLGHAVFCGLEYVKLCVEYGADLDLVVHAADGPAMAIAAYRNATDIIEYLLENGANLDVCPPHEHPLTAAVCSGQPGTVKKLLAHGVDLVRLL